MYMVDKNRPDSGFALLVSLIVVGVVLSVGLVILDLTIKQVRLAGTTKDSEIAFHAANAGMECARFWRRNQSALVISGGTMSGISCFGQPSITAAALPVTLGGGSGASTQAWHYEYNFTWGPGNDRCTKVNTITSIAPAFDSAAIIELSTMQGLIPGYPGTTDVICPPGSQCTTIAVRGYNQACPASGLSFGYGVVERKVLLEF